MLSSYLARPIFGKLYFEDQVLISKTLAAPPLPSHDGLFSSLMESIIVL